MNLEIMPDPTTGTPTIMTDEGDVIDNVVIQQISVSFSKFGPPTGEIKLTGTIKYDGGELILQ